MTNKSNSDSDNVSSTPKSKPNLTASTASTPKIHLKLTESEFFLVNSILGQAAYSLVATADATKDLQEKLDLDVKAALLTSVLVKMQKKSPYKPSKPIITGNRT